MNLRSRNGFTFIELMLVIIIMGILAALISGNFLTSLKKGRDSKRKIDLGHIASSLELYYSDKQTYPTPPLPYADQLCETNPCGATRVYMEKVPADQNGAFLYDYESDGTYFKLYSCIENDLDAGSGVDQGGYAGTNCGACGECKYKITSPNTQ